MFPPDLSTHFVYLTFFMPHMLGMWVLNFGHVRPYVQHLIYTQSLKIRDNCIVFENFTASIGDLMVAN
jgi:hypothetical protein